MTERVSGFALLAVGIAIIVLAAFSVFNVFSGRSEPVSPFSFPAVSLDASSLIGSDAPPEAREALRASGQTPKLELIPADILNKTSNTLAHLLLMGFIASIGYKIGSLGAMLARPVIVKLKTKNGEISTEDSSSTKA